jgi:hypothetical protein
MSRAVKWGAWIIGAILTVTLATALADSTFRYPVDGTWTVTNDFWSCDVQCWHLAEDSGGAAGTKPIT